MAQKTWDNEITKTQDWGGDATTNNLPVSGNRVQEFIKNSLENKMGNIFFDTTNNRYLIFADEENRQTYLADPTQVDLIMGTFDAPFNYTASVEILSGQSNVLLKGETGNFIEFSFDIADKQGNSTMESVFITYTFLSAGSKVSITEQYAYGTHVRFNIDKYLGDGETIIQIGLKGLNTLAAITRSVSYRVLDLELSSNYNISQINNLANSSFVSIPYYIKSSRHLFLRSSVNYGAWELVTETDSYEINGNYALNVAALGIGNHNIRLQAYVIIDGVTYYSNVIYKDILVENNNTLEDVQIMVSGIIPSEIVLDSEFKLYGLTQYVPQSVEIAIYNPNASSSNVQIDLTKGGVIYPIGSKTIFNSEKETITFSPIIFGVADLIITVENFSRTISTNISASAIQIAEITNALQLSLKALGRSNTDINKDVWTYNSYSSLFTGFSWNNQGGWLNNKLKINYGAYVDVNIAPLADNPHITGYTMEFEYSTELVNNENAVLIDLRNGETGLLLTASKASLTSSNGRKVETYFKSGETVRIAFVIDNVPIRSAKLMYIYINGVVSGAIDYLNTDNFNVSSTLRIGNTNEAILNLKDLRFYNRALSANEILNNYMLYQDTADDMVSIFNKNNIISEGRVSSEALANNLPVMIITGDVSILENTTNKRLPITVNVTYIDRQDPTKSFTMENAVMTPQGTSSMFYPKKNFRLYTKKNDNTIVRDYLGTIITDKLYAFKTGSIPVETWCMKADFAESSSSHNTGIARLWNDAMSNMQLSVNGTPTYVGRTQAQQAALDNDYQYDVRTTIDGFPICMFYHITENDPLIFLGKYNFNNDKSTEKVFGFVDIPGFDNTHMQCWEILDSGNQYALFTGDPSGFDDNWSDAYEGRYPDSSEVITDLKSFYSWVYGCRDDQTTFDTEYTQHIDKYKMAAYYIYLMRFGAVDQVAKNAMLTSEDGIHWYFINYDNDTILGLDNDGKLVYHWNIDRQSKVAGTEFYIYAAHDSVLWNRLEGCEEFMQIVRQVDQALYEARKGITNVGLTYENVIETFNIKQSAKWSERVYNEDARYKYIDTFINQEINQLAKLQGRRNLHREWWLSNRFNYFDGKWMTGAFTKDGIVFKCQSGLSGTTVNVVSGNNMYYGIKIQSNVTQSQYLEIGENYNFAIDRDLQIGTPVSICNPANVAEIDLSNFMSNLASFDMSLVRNSLGETRLKKLILGNALNINNLLATISGLSNATALQEINIEGFSLITTLTLDRQYDLHKVYALRSGLRDISLCPGCPLEVLQLPSSVTRLTLDSHVNLTNANLSVYKESISELTIINCSALDSQVFFSDWHNISTTPINDRVLHLEGINWIMTLQEVIDNFESYDSSNLDIRGTIDVSNSTDITVEQLNNIMSIFGNNCFSSSNSIYIKGINGVLFVNSKSNLLLGESFTYHAINFSDSTGLEYVLYQNGSPCSYDTIGGFYYTNSAANPTLKLIKSTGEFTTNFKWQNYNTSCEIRAYKQGSLVGYATCSVIINKIIFPNNVAVTGPSSINSDTIFTCTSIPNNTGDTMNAVINTHYEVSFKLKTADGSADLSSTIAVIDSTDGNTCRIKPYLEGIGTEFRVLATVVTKESTPKTYTGYKNIASLLPGIICTSTSNPYFMQAMYNKHLAYNSNYMTQEEAEAVTYLPDGIFKYYQYTSDEFEALRYFVNLKTIGEEAFASCSNITSITIPAGVETIGNQAFYNCRKLASIVIPSSVKTINGLAFMDCSSLSSIIFEQGSVLQRILDRAFAASSTQGLLITSIDIPDSVTEIGNGVFGGCQLLETVHLSNSLSILGSDAFARCHSLRSIYIPSSLNSIDYSNPFSYCESLETINVDPNNTTFEDCSSNVIRVRSSKSIRSGSNMSVIPSDTIIIDLLAFAGCQFTNTNIVFPNTITKIYGSCFDQSNITSVHLSSNLRYINHGSIITNASCYNPFVRCTNLMSLTIEPGNSYFSVEGNVLMKGTDIYASANNPIIPSSATRIYGAAFMGITGLGDIDLSGKTFYSSFACFAYAEVNSITVDSYPSGLFSYCASVKHIILNGNITTVYSMQDCLGLESVILPSSVTNIYDYCFSGCISLKSITCLSLTAPSVYEYTFGIGSSNYTGRNTYTTGENKLYVPASSTGYEGSYWFSVLLSSTECGFTKVEII